MYSYKNTNISIKQGDITKESTDAIVNAANNTLLGGGGVDGAIHRAGGPEILKQCKQIGGCPTGEARITVAGNLKANYVIHTVGPIYEKNTKTQEKFLYNAYYNSLKLAEEYDIRTISFPSISTGVYGYPIEEASKIALKAVLDYLSKGSKIELINFILFSEDDYLIYEKLFKEIL